MYSILRLQCFKSAWLYAFLHDGLKFPINYQRLRSASLVNNNDVQWTLGAILYKTRFLPLKYVDTLSKFLLTFVFRAINRLKNNTYSHQPYINSRKIAILICMILTLCLLIFGSRRIRAFLSRRKHLQSSSDAFNHRYQLLTSFASDDLVLPSNTYSNIKTL
jgi:hypothetical protein